MKKAFRCIAFLIVALLCILITQTKLGYRDDLSTQRVFQDFYSLRMYTTDVVTLGTSAVQRGWISPVAYHRYGIASYNMSTASQPFCLTKHLMKEVNRMQKPKVFIIDLRGAYKAPKRVQEPFIRRVTDNMSESPIRWNAIKEALTYASIENKDIDPDDLSFYIKLMKYHELYNPTKRPKPVGVEYFDGFAFYEPSYFNIVPQKDYGTIEERFRVQAGAITVLNDLLNYCDTLDSEVIFTLMPFSTTRREVKKLNTIVDIVENRGYKVINFMDPEHKAAANINFETCFYNEKHTNYVGSWRITDYLCKYLKENVDLPNKKIDIRCSGWQENYKNFRERTKENLSKMLQQIREKENSYETASIGNFEGN